MFKKPSQWKQFVKKLDTIMKKYEGRPHWGKYHQLTKQEVEALYPRWNDFQEVRKRLDPNGTFLNEYLSAYFA
jgi:FAD/FMN-containing dehydrogenase